MNIIYSICDYRYIILHPVRSQAPEKVFHFFFTNYLPIPRISDIIPFSTVRKRQKPEECLVYASSGFCGMAKMLYGNIILKFF